MKLSTFSPRIRSVFTAVSVGTAFALSSGVALAQETIKIGAPLALTGGLADEGKKQQIAYDMWKERVNAAGGISVGDKKMMVEIVSYDYQTDPKRAQQIAERLINVDKVDFLTAPFGSGHTKIVAGVAERYGVPIMASVASSESVYNQGYKYLFGTLAPNGGIVENMTTLFTKLIPSVKKVAILGREDVFPKAMAGEMKRAAEEAGLEIVYNDLYPVGTLDHSAALNKIKATQAQWIFMSGYTQDLILARKQMADLELTAPVMTMITGPAYKEFIDALGPLANGVTSASWWHHSLTYTSKDVFGSTQAFYQEFLKREKKDPDYVHASAAAALIALQAAIETAGSIDKKAVRDALADLKIDTFYGPIDFGENGMNGGRQLPIIQVQNGNVIPLYPTAIKAGSLIEISSP